MNRVGRHSDRLKAQYAASGMLSVKRAAAKIGVSERTVRRLIKAGALTVATIGGRYVVPERAAEAFIASEMRIGSVA